jgi:hypothetical protein
MKATFEQRCKITKNSLGNQYFLKVKPIIAANLGVIFPKKS